MKAKCGQIFSNNLLFTHRGISGPAILQISNYWQLNESLEVDCLPHMNVVELSKLAHNLAEITPKDRIIAYFTKSLLELWIERGLCKDDILAQLSTPNWRHWICKSIIGKSPNGTEGYRTAEVTMGAWIRKRFPHSMEAQRVSGLCFIGRVLDVTGQLVQFQWAWSSAYACAQAICAKHKKVL